MKTIALKLLNLTLSVAFITVGVGFAGWAVAAIFGLNQSAGTAYGAALGVLAGAAYGAQEWRSTPAN
jgi:hypothetical protein